MDDVVMIMEREAGMPENVPQVGVGFCLYPLKNEAESEKAGREIFKDVEFVRIQVPGDRESIYFQPATAKHRQRFPTAYRAFKEQNAVAQQGTPIEHWPAIGRGMALTFKAAGIPTVEALTEVHDGNLDKLGNEAREWRAKARGYVANATSSAAAQKLERERQQLLDLVENLQGQIRELAGLSGVDPAKLVRKPAKSKTPAKSASRKKAA